MLLAGETAGVVAIFEIGKSKSTGEPFMRKVLEKPVCDQNISKVVRTTRNDFVLGTAAGLVFFSVGKDPRTSDLKVKTTADVLLRDKDITEVSEFAQD